MYTVNGYGEMIADSIRVSAYNAALRAAVHPNSVVLDIGTGQGFFAMLACQAGARRVYAVEPSDIIQLAQDLAVRNGFQDRIEFIQDTSWNLALPEQVDVIVSDLRNLLPLHRDLVLCLADVRDRWLAEGGTLIPERDLLWAGIVEAPELYQRHTGVWKENGYDLDLQPALRLVTNREYKAMLDAKQLLTEPCCWGVLDYRVIQAPNVTGEASWEMRRSGTAHGISLWFDTVLFGEAGFSNAPGQPTIYGNFFVPWPEPVQVSVHDIVKTKICFVYGGEDYTWAIDSSFFNAAGKLRTSFRQSNLLGESLSPSTLRKMAADYVPKLGLEGEIDSFTLHLMEQQLPLGEIAHRLQEKFPAAFVEYRTALTRVGKLSVKYSSSR